MASLICAKFINVCVLAILIIGDKLVSVHPDISKILFRFMSENNCSHKYVLQNIKHFENQLNNFWTRNNSMLIKYHTGDSAERIRIIRAQFGRGGGVLGTPRLTALRLFLEKVFSSDHNSNLTWAILGT
jgi:hypothetical protein